MHCIVYCGYIVCIIAYTAFCCVRRLADRLVEFANSAELLSLKPVVLERMREATQVTQLPRDLELSFVCQPDSVDATIKVSGGTRHRRQLQSAGDSHSLDMYGALAGLCVQCMLYALCSECCRQGNRFAVTLPCHQHSSLLCGAAVVFQNATKVFFFAVTLFLYFLH